MLDHVLLIMAAVSCGLAAAPPVPYTVHLVAFGLFCYILTSLV